MRQRRLSLFLIFTLILTSCTQKSQQDLLTSSTPSTQQDSLTHSEPSTQLDSLTYSALIPEQIGFTPGTHARDDAYDAQFDTYDANAGAFMLRINSYAYTKERGEEIFTRVREDYLALTSVFKAVKKPTIYVIEVFVGVQAPVAGAEIFCTFDTLSDGSYRTSLIAVLLGTSEPWKIAGAEAYVFGSEDDDSMLKEYYGAAGHMDELSLFAAYFNDDIHSFEGTQKARQTAASFTRFLIDHYGVEAFLTCTFNDGYRNEWLSSIGISSEYSPAYDLACLDNATYTSTNHFPLVISANGKSFLFESGETFTPAVIMDMFSELYRAIDEMLDYVKVNAPMQYFLVAKNWEQSIRFYFGDTQSVARYPLYAEPDIEMVYTVRVSDLFHEVMRILIDPGPDDSQYWKVEGIAGYFTALFDRQQWGRGYSILTDFQTGDYFTGDNIKLLHDTLDYYLLKTGIMPGSKQDIDFPQLVEAMAVVTLTNPSIRPDFIGSNISIREHRTGTVGSRNRSANGNNLTYYESALLVGYLIECFGLDTVLEFCQSSNGDFEQYFGKTYSELFPEFFSVFSAIYNNSQH